jgi:hypothetical protein
MASTAATRSAGQSGAAADAAAARREAADQAAAIAAQAAQQQADRNKWTPERANARMEKEQLAREAPSAQQAASA